MSEPAVGMIFEGGADFRDAIDKMVARVDVANREAVSAGSHLVETKAKASFEGTHAKGQPRQGSVMGPPNVVSGAARRSIRVVSIRSVGLGMWEGTIAPTIIYARRLELGFHGVDSIGRHYDYDGNPYFRPGFDEAKRELPRVYRDAWAEAVKV